MDELSAVNERLERAVKELEGVASSMHDSKRSASPPVGGAVQLSLDHAAMSKAVDGVADRLDAAIARLAAALAR